MTAVAKTRDFVLFALVVFSAFGAIGAPAEVPSSVAHGGRAYAAMAFRDVESRFCREAFCWFYRDRTLVGRNVVTSCFISGNLRRRRAEPYGFMCDNGSVNVFTHRYIYVVVPSEIQPLYMRENNCGLLQCEFLVFGTVRFGRFTGPVPTPHIMVEGVVTGHSLQLHDLRRTGRRMTGAGVVGDLFQQFRTLGRLVGCR